MLCKIEFLLNKNEEGNEVGKLLCEANSMRELYDAIDVSDINDDNSKIFSFSIQKDGDKFCCIALAGQIEVRDK